MRWSHWDLLFQTSLTQTSIAYGDICLPTASSWDTHGEDCVSWDRSKETSELLFQAHTRTALTAVLPQGLPSGSVGGEAPGKRFYSQLTPCPSTQRLYPGKGFKDKSNPCPSTVLRCSPTPSRCPKLHVRPHGPLPSKTSERISSLQ